MCRYQCALHVPSLLPPVPSRRVCQFQRVRDRVLVNLFQMEQYFVRCCLCLNRKIDVLHRAFRFLMHHRPKSHLKVAVSFQIQLLQQPVDRRCRKIQISGQLLRRFGQTLHRVIPDVITQTFFIAGQMFQLVDLGQKIHGRSLLLIFVAAQEKVHLNTAYFSMQADAVVV